MNNNFYVYEHIRLDINEPFYVGKGRGGRAYIKDRRNPIWKNIVNKHGYIVNIFKENLYEQEALDLECCLIDAYKKAGYNLVNLTNGGEGISGYEHTEEARDKMRANGRKGKKHSEETKAKMRKPKSDKHRAKISQATLGKKKKPCSSEHKLKLREAQLGKKRRPLSDEHKDKLREAALHIWQKKLTTIKKLNH